jgi:hypothetical protein
MTPQPQTKTSELSDDLWPIFIERKNLNTFNRHRLSHEINSLRKVDPDGFLILSAVLAAVEGNEKETLDLAGIALRECNEFLMLINWSSVMIHLGKIREAFLFAKKSWNLAPENIKTNERLILLAAVIEDTETLELTLETWHRLNPGQIHPLAVGYQLNQKDTPLFNLDDESILQILNCLQKEFCEKDSPSPRLEALTRALMQEIDT